MIAIEPPKGHRQPGLKSFGESKKPGILDESLIDDTIIVPDEPAYRMAIRLAREESLLVGPSTGAIVHAAAEYLKDRKGVGVAIAPDNAFKYTSFLTDWVKNDGHP